MTIAHFDLPNIPFGPYISRRCMACLSSRRDSEENES